MSTRTARGSVRTSFTKTFNELKQEIEKDGQISLILVRSLAKRLETRYDLLCKADEEINEDMVKKGATQEELDAEFDSVMEYKDKFTDILLIVNDLSKHDNFDKESGATCIDNRKGCPVHDGSLHGCPSHNEPVHDGSANNSTNSIKSRYKLPKLELRKFSGDPKKWLDFWCQFKGIHEDTVLSTEEKFQYLIQSMANKSAAEAIVLSFPPTAANYPLAIDHLTSRFGQEKMLVEVYVRDLLKLVLQNTVQNQKLSMSTLYDKLETQLRGLETLGVASNKYASMLYPLVESAIPEEVLKTWERIRNQGDKSVETGVEMDNLKPLMKFLRTEVDSETRLKLARAGITDKSLDHGSKSMKKLNEVATASELFNGEVVSSSTKQCVFCDKDHFSNLCYSAKKMSKEEKERLIREKRRCFICLNKGHYINDCKAKIQCQVCGNRHYAIMCTSNMGKGKPSPSGNSSAYTTHGFRNVVLQTIFVTLMGTKMNRPVRALIDSGSQRSYITKKAVRDFGIESIGEVSIAHTLFGGLVTEQKQHGQFIVTASNAKDGSTYKFVLLDSEKICGSIPIVPEGIWLEELKKVGIELSDTLQEEKEIHILIGADVASKIYTGRIYHTQSGPVAFETIFGWALMGQTDVGKYNKNNAFMVTSLLACENSIVDMPESSQGKYNWVNSLVVSDLAIQDLWKLDVIGIHDSTDTKSREELSRSAMLHFTKTVSRQEDGRYEVSLPWIQGHRKVSNNRDLAENRLKSAVRKLRELKKVNEYQKIFNEWLVLGIIERVPESELKENRVSYLPHHPVFNPKSSTTPIRPVFDASAKQKGCPSLNDCLEKGPNLLELILTILMRFRVKRYGVLSDIKKAFLQISVKTDDRDFLRFLWYEKGEIVEYRHCRVVFGVSSSPFLLAATLNHHLDNAEKDFQTTAKLLKETTYVDNCVASVNNKQELDKFIREATVLCAEAKFELRGWIWSSNTDAGDVAGVGSSECGLDTGSTVLRNKSDTLVQVLGMLWYPESDTISLDLRKLINKNSDVTTKRKILSATHGIFDPIGLVAPVTIVPKVMMKEAFKKKLNWDDAVPTEVARKFKLWVESLEVLSSIRIPRWILSSEASNKSIHIFTDASKDAYAAVAFLRSEGENGVTVRLIMAKSRVSTIKPITIPKLELIGCECGAKMLDNIKNTMDISDIEIFLWTDSSNALGWIKKCENWQIFVFNRVNKIKELTNTDNWRHIPGHLNPADLPSRGCTPKQLIASKWWEGPLWLRQKEEYWPKSEVNYDEEIVMAEVKKVVVSQIAHVPDIARFFRYFSQFRKQVRMIAWMKRWRSYKSGQVRTGELSFEEEEEAEKCLWRMIQKECFHHTDTIVKQLKAWKDETGLWRVKTRIINREDTMEFLTPILLPKNNVVVERLIHHEHRKLNHAGIQTMMSCLREKYWINHVRVTARKIVHSCHNCRRHMAKPIRVVEAPLPLNRIRDAATFEISGIDLGGPLILVNKQKSWFVLFTCAVYRAIHLELLTSLSTDAFIQTLRRFIARRGRPTTIYTDNGTNFVGTNNLMSKLDWQQITNCTPRIKWIFNPPAAPWWGGWWERLVAMVKQLIRRILGRSVVDYEELSTILCDCEQVVNSRPLTYLTEDSDDLLALTPMMFLNDLRSQGVADLDLIEAEGLRKRFKYRQQIREDLRSRFRIEYLAYLVHKKIRTIDENNIKIGDVVIIEGDNTKRIYWPLGKVIDIFPSSDGISRSVKLKTSSGELIRPVQKLYPMEASGDVIPKLKVGNNTTGQPLVHSKDSLVQSEFEYPMVQKQFTRSGRQVKKPNKLNY